MIDLRCKRHKHLTVKVQVGDEAADLHLVHERRCRQCTSADKRPTYHTWTWEQIKVAIQDRADTGAIGLEVWPLREEVCPKAT